MMIHFNGWCAVRMRGSVFSQWKRCGKTSVQTFSNLFLETFTEGAVTLKARRLFQYVTTLTENSVPYPSAVARTLECLSRGLSLAASSRREENLDRISSKSLPLHGVKAQPLQSAFLPEVTKCLFFLTKNTFPLYQ